MKKYFLKTITVYIILVASLPLLAQGFPVVNPSTVKTPPVIDGDLAEPVWKNACVVDLKEPLLLRKKLPQVNKTRMLFLRDKSALFIGAECGFSKKPVSKKTKRNHDDPVFEDESVELFIAPGKQNKYYHFAVNISGSFYEGEIFDPTWNGEWSCKVKIMPDKWTAEIKIPYKTLGVAPKIGNYWRMNACRNISGKNGYEQSFAITYPGVQSPMVPLVLGPVNISKITQMLDPIITTMKQLLPQIDSKDKKQVESWLKLKNELQFQIKDHKKLLPAKDAARALSIIEAADINQKKISERAILNMMFSQ